ncbi:MAG: hypothetical protein P8H65_01190 [Rhodothermales bacterium]|nr:hypothetical protein [Rhodothermales bacterium]MDG2016257.1 hypothetical protein [Rhodothermales bacterium]
MMPDKPISSDAPRPERPVWVVQLTIFAGIFGFLLLAVPPIIDIVRVFLPDEVDPRGQLDLYADSPWAETHFVEFNNLETEYYDFIGWRRKAFDGETIHIGADGIRSTAPSSEPADSAETVYFMGGSVVWGTGSRDQNTIASIYARETGSVVTNYGESAWIAQQSTNLLIRLYSQKRSADRVYSIDGVNEVLHKCRAENAPLSGGREQRFRSLIASPKPLTTLYAVRPLLFMLSELRRAIAPSPDPSALFDCDTNPEKAEQIARNLVVNWMASRDLVEANGGRFIPVLQPVAYLGSPSVEHLPEINDVSPLGHQFQTVYPIIIQILNETDLSWLDLTDVFDSTPRVYIDFCHVVSSGNSVLVDRLLSSKE